MSLVNLSHLCSHLQNASKARLGLTSAPYTKLHLSLLHSLQRSGFLSTVTIGGPSPPSPSSILAHPHPLPRSTHLSHEELAHFSSPSVYPTSSTEGLSPNAVKELAAQGESEEGESEGIITQTNVATRRLWIGLKYWNSEPVLSQMGMVSKPTRRIWMGVEGLRDIAKGDRSGYVKGLRGVGECLYVSTDRGIMEVRECVERDVGGMVLCRAQ